VFRGQPEKFSECLHLFYPRYDFAPRGRLFRNRGNPRWSSERLLRHDCFFAVDFRDASLVDVFARAAGTIAGRACSDSRAIEIDS
jgi:hypothetical protein